MIIVTIAKPVTPGSTPGSDTELSHKLQAALQRQPWYADASAQLFVADGIVTVEGFVTDEAFAQALCAVARDVAGADKVCDGLMRVDAVSGSVLVMA